ncbi:hypothetical protein FQZ97_1081200 [compost metagenome]
MQKTDPRLPLAQFRRPRQQLQPLAPYHPEQRAAASFGVEIGQSLAGEHQLADLTLAFGAQYAFALVPVQFVVDAHLLG